MHIKKGLLFLIVGIFFVFHFAYAEHVIWCSSHTAKRIQLDRVIERQIRDAFSGDIYIKNCTFYEEHEDHFIYTFDINEHVYHLKCPISLKSSKGSCSEQCEVIS